MMDFLVTYGWMMMISLVVIGALAWYGVASYDKYLPTTCTTTGLVQCTDYKVGETQAQFRLRNNLGQPITGMVVTIEGRGNYQGLKETYTYTGVGEQDVTDPIILPVDKPRGRFLGAITIVYSGREASINHTITGKLTGSPEPDQQIEVSAEPAPLPEPEPIPEENDTFPVRLR
jgi:hypothetical protein